MTYFLVIKPGFRSFTDRVDGFSDRSERILNRVSQDPDRPGQLLDRVSHNPDRQNAFSFMPSYSRCCSTND